MREGRYRPQTTALRSISRVPESSSAWGTVIPIARRAIKSRNARSSTGLAQVIIQSTKRPGEIHVEAVKNGWDGPELMPAKLVITAKQIEPRPAVPVVREA